jgi:hypothetical protein
MHRWFLACGFAKNERLFWPAYAFATYMTALLPISYRLCHQFRDGSELIAISARWLINHVPPWEGQRTLQADHVVRLKQSIQNPQDLEGPYVVAVLRDEGGPRWGLVDGQHRAEVLREWFQTQPQIKDFMVVVRLKECASDLEVIELFRTINTQKPMEYELSPEEKQHELVRLLVAEYQRKDKGHKLTEMIRSGAKQRPFLATEVLLQQLRQRRFFSADSPGTQSLSPQEVADRIVTWNTEKAGNPTAYLATLKGLTDTLVARAATYGFYLGLDPKLGWLATIPSYGATGTIV